jgi:hypothetical protein
LLLLINSSSLNVYVQLSIWDLNSATSGNDFALDDLGFNQVPIPEAALLFASSLFGIIGIRRGIKKKATKAKG